MFDHQITAMVEALQAAGHIKTEPATAGAAHQTLRTFWTDKIAITWTRDDVRDTATGMGIRLGEEEIPGVLHDLLDKHDSEFGINWEVIRNAVERAKRKSAGPKDIYLEEGCPECGLVIPDNVAHGDACDNCGHVLI